MDACDFELHQRGGNTEQAAATFAWWENDDLVVGSTALDSSAPLEKV
jgi:hypothetical protein